MSRLLDLDALVERRVGTCMSTLSQTFTAGKYRASILSSRASI